jgi:hypothetical protein
VGAFSGDVQSLDWSAGFGRAKAQLNFAATIVLRHDTYLEVLSTRTLAQHVGVLECVSRAGGSRFWHALAPPVRIRQSFWKPGRPVRRAFIPRYRKNAVALARETFEPSVQHQTQICCNTGDMVLHFYDRHKRLFGRIIHRALAQSLPSHRLGPNSLLHTSASQCRWHKAARCAWCFCRQHVVPRDIIAYERRYSDISLLPTRLCYYYYFCCYYCCPGCYFFLHRPSRFMIVSKKYWWSKSRPTSKESTFSSSPISPLS